MTVKAGWEKSTNGPDWVDVENLMRALGAVHSGHVDLSILPAGIGSTGGVIVGARILFDVLPGSSLPLSVRVEGTWPCVGHATIAGHAIALLYQLDYEIGKTYKNEELWK